MPYRTSKQDRAGLANLLTASRRRRPITPQPVGELYRVTRAGATMGQLIRAESATAAVDQYRALFRTPADVALVVSEVRS
jgi:hypothetical protein